jgi:phage major head subunit gpT-like protein
MGVGPVSSSNFQKLLEPRLRKIFFDTYDEVPEQYPQVYNVNTSKKAREEDFHIVGVGLWPEKEPMGPIPYETIDPSFSVTYEHVEYAKGIQVERKLVDDEQYDVIDKLPKELARKGRATVETKAALVLSNGFTNQGYDGVPLFSTDHPIERGGVCSNKLTSPLTDAGLKEGILLMRKQVDPSGIPIQANPKKLIVPPDLEFTALTILNSAQVAGSNLNDINVVKGRLTPVVLDYLTDPNDWFLQDPDIHEMNFFWRVKPEFKSEENFDTMVAKYRGYLRFSVGYSNWRGMVGSQVA